MIDSDNTFHIFYIPEKYTTQTTIENEAETKIK